MGEKIIVIIFFAIFPRPTLKSITATDKCLRESYNENTVVIPHCP